MSSLFQLITLLLFISLSACSTQISHLTHSNDEETDIGMGGTGLIAKNDDEDNGLGGTGILGEITGFGSIFINGIEVEYDNSTPFTVDGEPAAIQQLQIGDIVEVLTVDTNNHTHARVINIRHEVIGKVESIDAVNFSLIVNGQTIILPINKHNLPEIGSTVAVSGFRINDKTIMSNRVVSADTDKNLLRTNIKLPFKGKTNNWLIQMHVKDKAKIKLNDVTHIISTGSTPSASNNSMHINILQIQKSASGQLKLKKTINPTNIPHGQRNALPSSTTIKNQTQKLSPGSGLRLWQRSGMPAGSGSGQMGNQSGNQHGNQRNNGN